MRVRFLVVMAAAALMLSAGFAYLGAGTLAALDINPDAVNASGATFPDGVDQQAVTPPSGGINPFNGNDAAMDVRAAWNAHDRNDTGVIAKE